MLTKLVTATAACILLFSAIASAGAVDRGGSDYDLYGPSGANGYGVISDYFLTYNGTPVKTTVHNQLSMMATNGQRRVILPIFFEDGAPGNSSCSSPGTPGQTTTLNSASGAIPAGCLTALIDIIKDAKSLGFVVGLGFYPQLTNDPYQWAHANSYDSVHAVQNWNFISSV